jgi:hypothetical protein
MSAIDIPERLKEKLLEGSFVHRLLKNIYPHLSTAHYFPEYTLHDHSHINAVLKLSDQLIPSETLNILSSRSIEILIGAIALHDLGMFIKRAGLRRLLFTEHKDRQNKYIKKLSWNETWKDFYKKALRYTDRELIRLFGDTTTVEKQLYDDIPTADTKYHRLLYGEFIRKNHHHLAFDIGEIGFPGNNADINIFENCDCDKRTKTIIGFIAQSHGMKLRDTEEFQKYYKLMPQPDEIPVFYLMAVLRMADYLDLGYERASKSIELSDEMHSPESKRQFHLNQAITHEPFFNEKQKSVNIIADPDCSSTYIDVENLLLNIQQELDTCWAVLAENYSYKYELSIHRLTSNLLDKNKATSFNEHFMTRKATLGINPDIVKHLVGPLYDNNPSYGVRELIQNAVDACNERSEIDPKIIGKINVLIDKEKKTFEINDNGIGMNEDILTNYFLLAGSSYRYSDAWYMDFITDDGKAKIARTGRFGIGVLASFLIGYEINVTTRHINDKLGFQFTFSKEPKTIDVKRVDTNEPGTRIEIKAYEESLETFKNITESIKYDFIFNARGGAQRWFDWYHFNKPKLCYYLNGKEMDVRNIFIIPDKDEEKEGWYDVKSNIFHSLKLRHLDYDTQKQIIVNGISIGQSPYYGMLQFDSSFSKKIANFSLPAVSVIDKNNKLDIDLKRTKILNFPDLTLVAEETFKYYLANILAIQESDAKKLILSEFAQYYIAVSNKGYTLAEPLFIFHTRQQKVSLLCYTDSFHYKTNIVNREPLIFPTPIIKVCDYGDNSEIGLFWNDEFTKKGFTVSKYWSRKESSKDNYQKYDKKLRKNAKELPLGLMVSKDLPCIVEFVPDMSMVDIADGNISLELLGKYIPVDKNDGWIPFNIDERKNLYPKAFSELERYMQDSHKHYKQADL